MIYNGMCVFLEKLKSSCSEASKAPIAVHARTDGIMKCLLGSKILGNFPIGHRIIRNKGGKYLVLRGDDARRTRLPDGIAGLGVVGIHISVLPPARVAVQTNVGRISQDLKGDEDVRV